MVYLNSGNLTEPDILAFTYEESVSHKSLRSHNRLSAKYVGSGITKNLPPVWTSLCPQAMDHSLILPSVPSFGKSDGACKIIFVPPLVAGGVCCYFGKEVSASPLGIHEDHTRGWK